MADRIDHAAKARDGIEWGAEWLRATGDTDAAQLGSLMIAQTHATLALVEQQRVTNLIALAEATRPVLREQVATDGWLELRPDIAAALGIEVQP